MRAPLSRPSSRLRKEIGIDRLTVMNLGVANAAGLLNLWKVGNRITERGINFDIVGFDTEVEPPIEREFRSHPENYTEGDYSLKDKDSLLKQIPKNARIEFVTSATTIRV